MTPFQNLFKNSKSPEDLKQSAHDFLNLKSFPTKKDENWKYTSLKSWIEKDYVLASDEGADIQVKSTNTYPLVFVNGHFQKQLSQIPSQVQVLPKKRDLNLQDSFDAVSRLNPVDTFEISIAANSSFEKPVEIIFISASRANEAYASAHVSLHVGSGSNVSVIENHLQHGSGTFFIYQTTNIELQANSRMEFVQIQNVGPMSFHLSKLNVQALGPSGVKTCVLSLGALQSRSELNLEIHSQDVSAEVLGVYALSGSQQSDHYTNIQHHVGGSQTTQLYKGLLDQSSKGVFNGGVYIAKDAQKANSEQLNKNLLLSSQAEINSKPQLQIYADDVKAAHGSTIGQLQKEELFYLQSRAIPKAQATEMLSQAFVMDVIEKLQNPILKAEATKALKAKTSEMQKNLKLQTGSLP